MSRFKNLVDAQRAHIFTLRAMIASMLIVSAAMWYGWTKAPDQLTIHVPPDLRSGSTRLWWDIPPENAYAFTLYVFGQLNRWPNNGEEDYKKNIFALQSYLTPACRATLDQDYQQRRNAGELRNRTRGVYEILGRGFADDPAFRVQQLDKNTWKVNLDLQADEYYLAEPVKRAAVRFPLQVVRFDIDPALNPYGLALNCSSSSQPQALQIEEKQ
jgi:integrating conjugative element protein, PFL_4703 family